MKYYDAINTNATCGLADARYEDFLETLKAIRRAEDRAEARGYKREAWLITETTVETEFDDFGCFKSKTENTRAVALVHENGLCDILEA